MTKGMRLLTIDGVRIGDKEDLLRLIGENGTTDEKLRRGQTVVFELEDLVLRPLVRAPSTTHVAPGPDSFGSNATVPNESFSPPADVDPHLGVDDEAQPADPADVRIEVDPRDVTPGADDAPPTPKHCLSSPESKLTLSRRSEPRVEPSGSPSTVGSPGPGDSYSRGLQSPVLSQRSFRDDEDLRRASAVVDTASEGSTDSSSYDLEFTFEPMLPFHRTIEAVTIPFLAAVVPRTLFYEIPLAVGSVGTFWTLVILISQLLVAMLSTASISCFLCKKTSAAGDSESCTPYRLFTRHVGTEYGGIVGILYWLTLVMLCSIAVQFAGGWINYHLYQFAGWNLGEIVDHEWRAVLLFIGFGVALQLLCHVLVRMSYRYIVLVETYILLVNIAAIIAFVVFLCTFQSSGAAPDLDAATSNRALYYYNSTQRLSAATFSSNWIMDPTFESPPGSAEVLPAPFRKSLVETFCRTFPATVGILIVLGRATDLQEPERELPRSTWSTLLATYVIFVAYALWIGGSLVGNWKVWGDADGHGGGAGNASAPAGAVPQHPLFDLFRGPDGGSANLSALMTVMEFLIVTNTLGHMVQVLSIAPFVVSAMANDHITSLLNPFQVEDGEMFPQQALVLSSFLSIPFALCGRYVYHVTTITALICLVVINGVAAFSSYMEPKMFDPSLGFYSWKLSFMGFILSLFAVFAVKWYYTLMALIVVQIGARYLEMQSDFSSWGEGIKGVHLQHALEKLRALEGADTQQSKNWRPQLMVLAKTDGDGLVAHPRLLAVADQMKAGKGLVVYCAIVEGDLMGHKEQMKSANDHLQLLKSQKSVKGFTKVIAAPTFAQGANVAMQGLGLGALSPNTVLCLWPDDWRIKPGVSTEFTHLLHIANTLSKAVIVVKGLDAFPDPEADDVLALDRDHIDLWWIAHDGGIELLIALLLRQNAVWKNTELRIFTIIPAESDSTALADELAEKLGRMRMHAILIVHPVEEEWIKEFTCPHEEEARQRAMEELKLTEEERQREVDGVLFNHHIRRMNSSRQTTGQQHSNSNSAQHNSNSHRPTPPVPPPAGNSGSHAFSPVAKRTSTCGSGPHEGSAAGFEGFPMVELAGDTHHNYPSGGGGGGGQAGSDYKNSPSYHFSCLNRLILEHSHPQSDLVLISLPEATNFTTPDEFMDCMETMLHGLRKSIMIRGTGEQIITGYW
eukprot:TRINITY_DN20802_c0_g1_i1.p1 TRINITY_DN20802_c0_g1~~TRINITY_DN20802_c0_g1_i1.p1  ORF type:complete len:1209 (+),score=428.75 TRINITY_DN20802_c0_g1_i1:55-3627(+)